MILYCKKPFQQFKKGDELPDLPNNIAMKLVAKGLAQSTKPRKKKTEDVTGS